MSVLAIAVAKAEGFRAEFVREGCHSEDDVMSLAIALMQQAEIIFKHFGGPQHAAAQFAAAAEQVGMPITRSMSGLN